MTAYSLVVTTGAVTVTTNFSKASYVNLKKFKRISRRRRLRSVKKLVRNKLISF